MTSLTVGEFKKRFSEVLKWVENGEIVEVSYGRKKKIVGIFKAKSYNKPKVKIGLLKGKAQVKFAEDFKLSEEEFLGL